jgi:hypothetical protein
MSGRYCNVLKYIQKNNKDFYAIIEELCADYLYKTSKWDNTFLLPNDKLISKINKKIKDENEKEAVDMLKSLILKGKYTESTSGKVYNLLNNQLDDLTTLNKNSKLFKGVIWSGDNKVVYNYEGDEVPSSIKSEKKSGGYGVYDKSTIEGGDDEVNESRRNKSKKLLEEYTENKNCYKEHIASLMVYLKTNKQDVYESLCYVIDTNPVVSWYLFIEHGKTKNLIIPDDVFNDWVNSIIPANGVDEIYENCFEHVKTDTKKMNEIKNTRDELCSSKCSKVELPKGVIECYEEYKFDHYPKHLQNIYNSNKLYKLFQDEVRYLYSDDEFFESGESIQILHNINWDCTNHSDLQLCNTELYNTLIQPKDFFNSGIVEFVKSTSFLYIPFNKATHDKIGGAIKGGSNINYTGGKSRKSTSKGKKINLKALIATIKTLDDAQLEEIKSRLM